VGRVGKENRIPPGRQRELEKQLKAARQRQAADTARTLLGRAQKSRNHRGFRRGRTATICKPWRRLERAIPGCGRLGAAENEAVSLVAAVTSDFTARVQAGKLIQAVAPIVGAKVAVARPCPPAAQRCAKLTQALNKARELVASILK